jgi:two-component system NtrC family response regulator
MNNPAQPQPAAAPPSSTVPPAVLLVEDHADLGELLRTMLQGHGFHVRLAGSCSEAIDAGRGQKFDLMIGDLSLPDGNGLSLLEEVRKIQPGLPAIALSGYGEEADIGRSLAAGYAEHICKTGDLDAIIAAIQRTLA